LVNADCAVLIFVIPTRKWERTVMNEFGDAGYCRRPACNNEKREYHFWRDRAMETQENGPFGMVVEVARANLDKLV
jgi:hypothetical protein